MFVGTQATANDRPSGEVKTSSPPPNSAGESGTALEHSAEPIAGDEETLWEGQYSAKIVLMRVVIGALLSIAWFALGLETWAVGHRGLAFLAWAIAAVLLILWVLTGLKVFHATHGHHYRLTSRRLFVRTGLLRRPLDQVDLLHVKDVFVHQSLLSTWLSIGHVVVVSSEQSLPRATLYGIDQSRRAVDLVWVRTRARSKDVARRAG
jgi:hypothetical protein